MPVTELAFIPLPSPHRTIPPPLEPLLHEALTIQDKWCDETPASSRGAAFFLSIPDPTATTNNDKNPTSPPQSTTILCTAHWSSQSQHHDWIASSENLSAFKPMFPHIDVPNILFFHVRDAELFPFSSSPSSSATTTTSSSTKEGEVSPNAAPLSASYVSVSRFLIRVGEGGKDKEEATKSKSAFEEKLSASHRRGGWRIEPVKQKELLLLIDDSTAVERQEEDETAETANGIEEYDLVGGWDGPKDAAAAVWDLVRAEDEELAKMAVQCERWLFQKVC